VAEHIFLAVVICAFVAAAASGRIRIDLAAILLLISLVLPWRRDASGGLVGILDASVAFSGFGSMAVAMIVAMFVLSAAMERTGAAGLMGERLLRRGAASERGFTALVIAAVTLFSAVASDTTSVLVWMPLVLAVCRERGFSSSRILMPLAFADLLGGQWTLIGTRTNVVISDFLKTETGEGLGFLSFTPIAVANWVVVGSFLLWIGRRLLPAGGEDASLADRYDVQEYLTEVMVTPDAAMVGRTMGETRLERDGLRVLGVVREGELLPPSSWIVLRSGDVFVVQGRISHISALISDSDFEVKEEMRVQERTLRSVDLRMAEALVAPGSRLEGQSLEELDYQSRYGLSVLAVGRGPRSVQERPMAVRLRAGDSLLFVGHEEMIRRARRDPDLFLLESRSLPVVGRHAALRLLLLMGAMVLAAAFRLVDPALAVVLGAVGAVLIGCIGMRQALEAVDWRIVLVLGGILPFGLALERTGAAAALAENVVGALAGAGPLAVFGALLLLVVILTQLVENTAVAIVIAPVAYRMALQVGADPVPFLLGTALCASAGFASPLAHECTLLVMGPGAYRFRDYLVVGVPAALLTWLVTLATVPLLYPLVPG